MSEELEWIGVDFDGTLAEYHGWVGHAELGDPIPKMVNRVKGWLAEGKSVKIFTARIFQGVHKGDGTCEKTKAETIEAIENWCELHVGQKLEVTNIKDYHMTELWDDRAIAIETNTGDIRTHERVRENWEKYD